ncbi:MAG: hypothetical protein ACRETL_03350, partial [Gammaproteobacteria bacterium]
MILFPSTGNTTAGSSRLTTDVCCCHRQQASLIDYVVPICTPNHRCIRLKFSAGIRLALAIFFLGCLGNAAALTAPSESDEPLTEKVYDPTATLTQLQFKNIYTPAEYGTDAQPNTLQIRTILAVDPLPFFPLEQLVRPTARIVTVPQGKGASTVTSYDDMQLLDLAVIPWPGEQTRFRWGLGPYFVFPTSGSAHTGNGAWELGPAFGFSYRGIPGLNISGLMQQAASFAYTSSQSKPVSFISYQPILTYQLGNRWYLKSSDATWTFNFRHNTSTQIPLSAGFGRVWKLAADYSVDT